MLIDHIRVIIRIRPLITDTQTYGLRRLVTHTDVCSLCATRNRMRAPSAPSIFHQGPLKFSKNIVSLLPHGAYRA